MPPRQAPAYIPSVRALQLAALLRHYRADAGYSQARVGASFGWSQQKVAAIETCARKADVDDVRLMADLYGVVGAERDAVLALAAEVDRRNWWTDFGDVFQGPYVALEDAAEQIDVWSPQLIPGIMQTPDYARTLMTVGLPDDPVEVERRLRARMQRQAILTRPKPPRLNIVLDEVVVRRPVGEWRVHADQMTRLLSDQERESVVIQVLPADAGAHLGVNGGVTILHLPPPADRAVGYCEGQFGAVYLENPHEVARCTVAFERIREIALSPQESAAMIKEAATSR